MKSESRILAARLDDGVVWFRIVGKGSFHNSPDLKRFAESCLEDGGTAMVVDLEDCAGMDSTFMGTLTGLAVASMRRGGNVTVVNASGRNRQLLENLGLDQILNVDADGAEWRDWRDAVSRQFRGNGEASAIPDVAVSKEERARHMLEAHETLGAANPENAPRFRDVIEFLRKDLERQPS